MAKRIVRLTESDLMRIVKRVIKEAGPDKSPNPKNLSPEQLALQFKNSFGKFTDDEATANYSVLSLKNESDYNRFSSYLQKISGMSVKQMLNKYMSPIDGEYDNIVKHISDITNNKVNVGQGSTTNTILRGLRRGLGHDPGSSSLSGTGA